MKLCKILSISIEDSLSIFSVESFVPVLVTLLNQESNPKIMLLDARALTHLCDILPQACVSVVHYGVVPSFCDQLLTIEYMDLEEQVCITYVHTIDYSCKLERNACFTSSQNDFLVV